MTKKSLEIKMANNGFLLLNKEKGITSFGLVKMLRKLTQIKKIGHAGTLDPLATGLMVMLIGKDYTRKADLFLGLSKEYRGTICLGQERTTYDEEGDVTHTSDYQPTLEEIETALKDFQGKVLQTPPMFSAKKVKGQKLYDLARKGITIEREPVEVELNTQLISYAYPYIKLHIACSKGTYIRSIAHDLGEKLKCYAYLSSLERTKIGIFDLKNALSQSDLSLETLNQALIHETP